MKVRELHEMPRTPERCRVRYRGLEIPVNYRPGSRKVLIVLFHGNVDQSIRPLPVFQPLFDAAYGAHQLSVSDPTLYQHAKLNASWYLGSENVDLRSVLPAFIAEFAALHDLTRVIYFGGSAGGHAALHYSYLHPGSLALAVNPQINLWNWGTWPIGRFRAICWPSLSDDSELASKVDMDLGELYAGGMTNYVCLLNSCGDRRHVYEHSVDFLRRLPGDARQRVVFHCDYYGIPGHPGSVPFSECGPWIRAAVLAKSLDADTLLTKFHEVRADPARGQAAAKRTPGSQVPRSDELAIADAIRDYELGKEV